ncbi:hypothetical protein [Streptomyces sp. NPDC054863]
METLRAVLGVAQDIRPALVLERAARREHRLAATVCSVAAAEGLRLGALGEAMLETERARREEYGRLVTLARRHGHAEVLKGATVQRHYPDGVHRTSRDVDLLMSGAEELWAAVEAVVASVPVDEARVSMVESGGHRHWAVALNWPSPRSDLDPPYAIEFLTAAFVGNGTTVPLRARCPQDPVVASLLLIAEELFQQRLRGRDLVDAAVLFDALPVERHAGLLRAACDWRLAPEVHELAGRVCGIPALSGPAARWAAGALSADAEREQARRTRSEPAGDAAAARVRYGFFLGEEMGSAAVSVEENDDMIVLRCPTGGYLMVDSLSVSMELAEATQARYPQAVIPW